MKKKLLQASLLGVLVVWGLTPATALAGTDWDEFDGPSFSVGTASSRWTYFVLGSFVANDGITSFPSEGTLRVVSKGVNPTTGKPAFTRTVPQTGGGVDGGIDHVKWLVYMNNTASSGYLGFDAAPTSAVRCEAMITGQVHGVESHPFGAAVSQPSTDARLAAFALNTADFETGMVFDFFFTNERVYAVYERLPFMRTSTNRYAAFTYLVPVATRTPSTVHTARIEYDRGNGRVRWNLQGTTVFELTRIGRRIDRQYLLIDHGGVEQTVAPRQLACGMGTFTLLDGYSPASGKGLVRLSSAPNHYFLPHLGEVYAQSFVDESSQASSRLFGQGVDFRVTKYTYSSSGSSSGSGSSGSGSSGSGVSP